MKTRWILLPALAMLLPVLAQAQSSSYEDDLYYNPKKTKVETPKKESASKVYEDNTQNESVRVYDNSGTLKRYDTRSVDEYNRRAPQTDSEEVVENESNSVDENGQPFEYAERIRRFHDPKFTTHITDEEYLDIYIENGADVNVYYVDNSSNGWMSPFYYDSFYYPRYGYRWNNYGMYYNPWGYSSWGYYDPWYAGSYGWNYGFGGGYYGYGYGGYYDNGGYYGGGHYHGNMGDGGHSRYNRLSADQHRFLSNNGSGRTSTSNRTSGANAVRSSSASRSAYGTTSRSGSGTSTRSGSGTSTRSSYGTTTRTNSGTTTRSNVGTTTRSSTTTAPSSTTTTRTSRSGNSTSETRSSTPTESAPRSTYTPSTSTRSSYTPSSSSSNASSSSSSSSSRSSGGGSSSSGRR